MPRPAIDAPYVRFVEAESKLTNFMSRSSGYYEYRNGGLRPLLQRDRYQIAEIAFLGLLLEWELFLEETFARFLCDANRRSLPQPRLNARFSNLATAKDALRGRSGFAGWMQPDEIIRLSDIYFRGGEPFHSPIRASYATLEEIRTTRNRIAHSSERALNSFSTLIRAKYGYGPRGMTPGRFLLDGLPANAPLSQYQVYSQTLTAVAGMIVG